MKVKTSSQRPLCTASTWQGQKATTWDSKTKKPRHQVHRPKHRGIEKQRQLTGQKATTSKFQDSEITTSRFQDLNSHYIECLRNPNPYIQPADNLGLIRPVFCIGAIVKPNWSKVCKKKSHRFQALGKESRTAYYVLLLFRYGLSYLLMWSLRMIMCTFCLVEWSYNLIVRSLYLVMCTSHLVIISYFLVMCSYHLLQRCFYLVMRSCHSVMCSFRYVILSFYVLFVCALWVRSFYCIFRVVWELKN